MNDKGDRRTALATPGLLNIPKILMQLKPWDNPSGKKYSCLETIFWLLKITQIFWVEIAKRFIHLWKVLSIQKNQGNIYIFFMKHY